MRETEAPQQARGLVAPESRFGRRAASLCLAAVALATLTACSGGGTPAGGAVPTSTGMPHSGPAVTVRISRAAIENKPKPWVLDTPENAVRSHLAWAAYANRIAQSEVASATMTPFEGVVVDSYIQYNLQRGRILDEALESLTFGKASTGATSTLLPVREKWVYSYLSPETGKSLGGPYKASYEATYTVVKTETGEWRVDHSVTKPIGEVK